MSRNSANLDVLRAIAVLMVFFYHLLEYGYFSERRVSRLGQFGVLIFFVHTSLVLMMSMERNSGAVNFYIRRFFRIYPLSMLVVGLVTVLHIPSHPAREYASLGTFNLLSNFALTMNLTHSPMALAPPLELAHRSADVSGAAAAVSADQNKTRNSQPASGLDCAASVAYFQPLMKGPHNVLRFSPYGYGWAECLALGLAIPFFREVQVQWVRRAAGAIAKYSYGIYLFHLSQFTASTG